MEKHSQGNTKPMEDAALSLHENVEEAALLRRQISSFSLRGDYKGAAKFIEDNIKSLYQAERWPDIFFTVLRTYRRFFTSLGLNETLEAHLTELLKKNGIPFVFVHLLRGADSSIVWSADYFKDFAVLNELDGDLETALSYCDLALKIDPANSTVHTVRGWMLDHMGRPLEAVEMYRQAIELNDAAHGAINSLAKHCAGKNPQQALELVNRAIELSPTDGAYYDTKAKILMLLDDTDGAVTCYDLAMSASPYTADYPYHKAELLLSSGREIAAVAMFKKAVALDDKHIPSLWRLAVLYQESQPELALSYANAVVALDGENKEAKLIKCRLLSQIGDESAAAVEYKKLVLEMPKNHEACAGLASLLVISEPESAVLYYNKAISIAPKTAEYHMGKARALENLEQVQAAIKEYRTVISADKNNARAYGRLASLLADTKPKEAVECYTKAIAIMPENAFYYAAKAELLMKTKNGKAEAIACFSEASKHDPNNGQLHIHIARLLEETGNVASAGEHYRRAVTSGRSDADTFYRLARLTFSAEPDVALMHINSALSLDGTNADYYYLKAQVLNALGHNKGALKTLTDSLSADGKNPEILNELSALTGKKSPRLSLAYLNRAIELQPDNADYLCARSDLYLRLSETEKAKSQYEEVLRLEPKNHAALFGFARCLAANQDSHALDSFNKAIALEPKIAAYYACKADFLLERRDFAAAVSVYDQALAIEPDNWEYIFGKAKALEASGRLLKAAEYYGQAAQLAPECAEALGHAGILLAEHDPAKAIEYLNRAIALSPEDYTYRAFRGKALMLLGSADLALEEYKEAAKLGGETAETYYGLASILRKTQPETALGYCLRAIKENTAIPEYHLLCGELYDALNLETAALGQYNKALSLKADYHEALERIADMQILHGGPGALNAVNTALQSSSKCSHCLMLKIGLLEKDTESDHTDEIIGYLEAVLDSEPARIPERRKLIALLQKKRMYRRYVTEKLKLNKLLKSEKEA
ncbi:MAG: tetratricopeptide repeat protein [Oscillospiraceae bacterium]|nr:tetratricopeptide repeat protein [Oscillospiraceae bacterium]